jgi:hypothetical protein
VVVEVKVATGIKVFDGAVFVPFVPHHQKDMYFTYTPVQDTDVPVTHGFLSLMT